MEQGLHIQSAGRIRNNKREIKTRESLVITDARFLGGYKIFVTFSNGKQRIINFEPLFNKFLKGYYEKFLSPGNFKKFILSNGNISWGKNEEVIFPVSFLYSSRYGRSQKEQVVYIF